MKKLLIIFFLLISITSFAQIKVLKVIGQPGIAKADSVNGYVTPTQLKSKINYTDSSSMLSPYLRKNDTTGKWISPAVANATYATIANLNLKANDNAVVHNTLNENLAGQKTFTDSTTFKNIKTGVINSVGANGGDIRSWQGPGGVGDNYISLKTDATIGKSGIFRSNTDFPFYYSTLTGSTNIVSTVSNQPIIFGRQVTGYNNTVTQVGKFDWDGNFYLNFVSDVTGDFLTRNSSSGLVTRRTASEVLTDIGAEPTITAGTTSQYWSGNKTWQNVASLPVQTAVQTALNAKLDTSFKQNLYAADPIMFSNDSTITVRQSFVDSLRNAGFATKVLGFDVEGDTTVVNAYKNIVIRNFGSLMFQGANNVFQYGWIPFNLDNGGLYSYIEDRNGVVRENIVLTPTGIGVDGLNTPTAKVHFPASSGKAGDAPIKIDGGKLLTVPENGAIERDSSSERLFDTHLGIRDKIAYESDLKNYLTKDSIGNRNYANDSLAVANGHLGLYDFYRTGDVVKVVTTLPNFVFTYTVDYTTGANDSAQFFINMLTTNSPINVDWGDGTVENFSSYGTALSPPHKYTSYGTYIVRIGLGVNGGNLVNKFWSNNYPYAAKITSVTNLDQLSNITDIDLGGSLELTNTTVDFAYPSTLIKLGINSCGLTSFVPTHNLPATLNYLNLQNNSLNSAAVDSTLNWLANTQTFNAGAKNLYITQGGSAPPTSASSAAITTLQSEGWTITHD